MADRRSSLMLACSILLGSCAIAPPGGALSGSVRDPMPTSAIAARGGASLDLVQELMAESARMTASRAAADRPRAGQATSAVAAWRDNVEADEPE